MTDSVSVPAHHICVLEECSRTSASMKRTKISMGMIIPLDFSFAIHVCSSCTSMYMSFVVLPSMGGVEYLFCLLLCVGLSLPRPGTTGMVVRVGR
jgi:hypothetical protein